MWAIYALYFAIIKAVNFYIFKRLTRDFNPLTQLVNTFLFSIPFALIILLVFFQIPTVTPIFYFFVACSAVLDLVAFFLTFKAFKMEDISLLAPLSAFIPVFSLIFAALFLHEYPGVLKIMGILLVVVGTYVLNLSDTKRGIFKPLTRLFSSRALIFFLMANFIWSITPLFQKKAILQTTPVTPLYVSFIGFCIITVLSFIIALLKREKIFINTRKNWKILSIHGFIGTTSQMAAFTAFALAPLAYSLSLFNISTLVTIGIGAVFLKEHKTRDRFFGALIMIAGSLLIIF